MGRHDPLFYAAEPRGVTMKHLVLHALIGSSLFPSRCPRALGCQYSHFKVDHLL